MRCNVPLSPPGGRSPHLVFMGEIEGYEVNFDKSCYLGEMWTTNHMISIGRKNSEGCSLCKSLHPSFLILALYFQFLSEILH